MDGATGVVLDAQPVLSVGGPAVLADIDGNVVATATEDIGGGLERLVPEVLLDPETTYTITVEGRVGPLTTFSTGLALASGEVASPGSIMADGYVDRGPLQEWPFSCWGKAVVISLSWSSEEALHEVEVVREAGTQLTFLTLGESWGLGWDVCTNTIADLTPQESLLMRVRSFDLAGNVSDWSGDLDRTPRQAETGCGCAQSGSSPAFFASLGLLLALRRRQGRHC